MALFSNLPKATTTRVPMYGYKPTTIPRVGGAGLVEAVVGVVRPGAVGVDEAQKHPQAAAAAPAAAAASDAVYDTLAQRHLKAASCLPHQCGMRTRRTSVQLL